MSITKNSFKKLVGVVFVSTVFMVGMTGCSDDNNSGGNSNNGGDVLNAPTNVIATAISSSSIEIKWNSVANADGYDVFRSTSSGGTFTQIGSSPTTDFVDTDLSANTRYFYRVAAYNSDGAGARSNVVNATTFAEDEDEELGWCGNISGFDFPTPHYVDCGLYTIDECEKNGGVFFDFENEEISSFCLNPNLVCNASPPNVMLRPFNDPIGITQTALIANIMGRGDGMDGPNGPLVRDPTEMVEQPWTAENSVRLFTNDLSGNRIDIPWDPDPRRMFTTIPGNYTVEYTARRPSNCEIGEPGSITLTRMIRVVEFAVVDTITQPIIALAGNDRVSLILNTEYEELGLVAVRENPSVGVGDISHLDSIVIRVGQIGTVPIIRVVSSGRIDVASAATWVSNMFNGSNLHREEQDVSITYHVTSPTNGVSASVVRTVEVRGDLVPPLPSIQIVLNKATSLLSVDGQLMTLRTTRVHLRGSQLYNSPGVADAFYVTYTGDTVRTNPISGVLLRQEITNTQLPGGIGPRNVIYSHEGVPDEAATNNVARSVIVTDPECETSTPPTISVTPLTLTPADIPWNPDRTTDPYWTPVRQDWVIQGDVAAGPAYRFETVLDHNPLNILDPQNPRSGTYTIYHIGLGQCGGMTAASRQVTVP